MQLPGIAKLNGGDAAQRANRLHIFSAGFRAAPAVFCVLLSAFCAPAAARAQDPEPPADETAVEEEKPLPGDWAVALLDKISNSPNPEARDELLRAVMAAGPSAIPLLEPALQDDRTAEFAAQALAYLGGEKALQLLWGLTSDYRDLNLRRYYYGALAEFDAPEAVETLLDIVKRADAEPDRTVTETAIVALTVRSDPKVLPPLREVEKHILDIVIRLDLENAIEVIERRAKYLATGQKKSGGSVEYAVRTYFSPALEAEGPPPAPAPKPAAARRTAARPTARPAPAPPPVNVHIQNITLSPGGTRALARVVFEDPTASATYDFVLQKQFGDWNVASVWTGTQVEKALPSAEPPRPKSAN